MKLKLLVALMFSAALAAPASAGTFANITIDGSFADWAGVPLAYTDLVDNAGGVDFDEVYIANDYNYLYVRFTLHSSADPFTFLSHTFFDVDSDDTTGFDVIGAGNFGAELMTEGFTAYQEAGGGFNEGALAPGNSQFIQAPFAVSATDFEFRISRSATYVTTVGPAVAGAPIFVNDSIRFLLQTGDATGDTAGDDAIGIAYEFIPEPGSAALIAAASLLFASRRRRP